VLGGEQRRRAAAGGPELQGLIGVAHAAGHVDQLAQRDAEGRLVLAGGLDVPGQAEDPEAGGLLGAHPGEPVDALEDDAGHRGDGLDVVDRGRAGVQARSTRERRLAAGLAAPALEAVQEGGLLAADVGARAGVDGDVEVDPGSVSVMKCLNFFYLVLDDF